MARFSDDLDPMLQDLVGDEIIPVKKTEGKEIGLPEYLDKMFENQEYPELEALAKTPKREPVKPKEEKVIKSVTTKEELDRLDAMMLSFAGLKV